MSTQVSFPNALSNRLRRESEAILSEVEGVSGVVVASIDGFDLVSVVSGKIDARRIAAMASSIVAISQVVSQETEMGATRNLIVQSDGGYILFRGAQYENWQLLITVVANQKAILAQINYRAAQLAKLLVAA